MPSLQKSFSAESAQGVVGIVAKYEEEVSCVSPTEVEIYPRKSHCEIADR